VRKEFLTAALLGVTVLLTSCSMFKDEAEAPQQKMAATIPTAPVNNNYTPTSLDNAQPIAPLPENNAPIAGNLERAMDETDKVKLSRALDKALGKVTQWTNMASGIKYSVVPIAKFTYLNNPYCRKYQITATRNNSERTVTGTACVSATDANWQVVN
jgi:hypothetical protein